MRWSLGADGGVPRRAQRRGRVFFWPTRASSCHHSSIAVSSSSFARIAATAAERLFERRQGGRVLLVVARAHRQLAEAERLDRALVQADPEAGVGPGDQILQPSAHHPAPARVGPFLDGTRQSPPLRRVQLGRGAGGRAIDQPGRALRVGGHDPIAYRLQTAPIRTTSVRLQLA